MMPKVSISKKKIWIFDKKKKEKTTEKKEKKVDKKLIKSGFLKHFLIVIVQLFTVVFTNIYSV